MLDDAPQQHHPAAPNQLGIFIWLANERTAAAAINIIRFFFLYFSFLLFRIRRIGRIAAELHGAEGNGFIHRHGGRWRWCCGRRPMTQEPLPLLLKQSEGGRRTTSGDCPDWRASSRRHCSSNRPHSLVTPNTTILTIRLSSGRALAVDGKWLIHSLLLLLLLLLQSGRRGM